MFLASIKTLVMVDPFKMGTILLTRAARGFKGILSRGSGFVSVKDCNGNYPLAKAPSLVVLGYSWRSYGFEVALDAEIS